jgi:hypothetical protein
MLNLSALGRNLRATPVLESMAVAETPAPTTDLAEIAYSGNCRRIAKWAHYFEIYERHLSTYRGSDFRMLEIGVFGGGSLDLWREYFGPNATIFGIDVREECRELNGPKAQVRIGLQSDASFLQGVFAEMGGLDVVLDDGSHKGADQWASFETLFPLMNEGGLYIIEDVCTSYWLRFSPFRSAIGLGKRIVDDMHAWYHGKRTSTPGRDHVGGVHFYDSMIVIEKKRRQRPSHSIVG